MQTRKEILAQIKSNPDFDVLITGAGINGIGTFRDLALQGVRVLIIDRGDFCSGASMASSHMLHGGIRYLENGEFRLVKEALNERNRLLRNAPHLAKPLPTVIPIYKRFSGLMNAPFKFIGLLDKPGERGALVIKVGLLLYDFYVRKDSPMPKHKFRSREESLELWPALNPNILYTASYYDGAMPSPERICIELINDALADSDQLYALNYVTTAGQESGKVFLKDELTGEEFSITPKVVVNAAGPWIDLTNRSIGEKTKLIGGTKGSHIILEHPELRKAIGDYEFFFEYFDGRIVLIYPYLDKVMIGTTDIRVDDPDQVECTDEEIDYMLDMVPHVFPKIHVSREQIIFQFSGVRPLPAEDGDSTGQISRDHSIEILETENDRPFPILNLIGGKWTTYRAFAEHATEESLTLLGKVRVKSTADLPIGGGINYPLSKSAQEEWIQVNAELYGIPVSRMDTLFERYGTSAKGIAEYCSQVDDYSLGVEDKYTSGEIRFITKNEGVCHLDDLLLRRSLIAWMGEINLEQLKAYADVVGDQLDWDENTRLAEIERTARILSEVHRMIL